MLEAQSTKSDYDSYEPTTIHKILMNLDRFRKEHGEIHKTNAQHALWSLRHPVMAEVNLSMKELTSVGNMTNEQYNDQSLSHI